MAVDVAGGWPWPGWPWPPGRVVVAVAGWPWPGGRVAVAGWPWPGGRGRAVAVAGLAGNLKKRLWFLGGSSANSSHTKKKRVIHFIYHFLCHKFSIPYTLVKIVGWKMDLLKMHDLP